MAYNHEPLWTQIKSLAEAGRYQDLQSLIEKGTDLKERVALYRFAVRSLMFRDWSNKSLIPIIQLGDAGIETALEDFKQHPEDLGLKDEANIICYNMSANLAGCWNDGFTRTPDHYHKGLNYAERALQFRHELKKGPRPFSIAYWAKGIHEFFLGDFVKAEESFSLSLKNAEASFDVLIARGYLALAQLAQKKSGAESTYNQVLQAFEEMKTLSEDAKQDAEMGIDQLRNTRASLTAKI